MPSKLFKNSSAIRNEKIKCAWHSYLFFIHNMQCDSQAFWLLSHQKCNASGLKSKMFYVWWCVKQNNLRNGYYTVYLLVNVPPPINLPRHEIFNMCLHYESDVTPETRGRFTLILCVGDHNMSKTVGAQNRHCAFSKFKINT